MNILIAGDIMPGGVLPYQDKYLEEGLSAFLASHDFRVGTLEAPIGTGLSFDPEKTGAEGRQNIVYARNEDFFRMKEMGFDVVSLANNHIWDLGEEGLRNTISKLDEAGIAHCGAGMTAEEASRPAVITKDGFSVAFLAYCVYGSKWLGRVETASADRAGVNALEIDRVEREIKEAKKRYDRVVVLPHWGREYKYRPLPECVKMAKRMIDAGADAVMGSHTHQIQPLINYKGGNICFSMGNFLFPDFYMMPPRPIWYPDRDEDLSAVKDVVGYPFPISEPIRQIWNEISRYGRIVSLNVDGSRMLAKSSFVHLSKANVLSLCDLDVNIGKSLDIEAKLLRSTYYRMVCKLKKTIRKIIK